MSKSKQSKSSRSVTVARRNPLHDHPLLRKSAVHEKSKKAVRQRDRVKLRKEWLPLCA